MSTTSINNIIDSDLTAKPISKPELVKTLKDMTSALETDIGAGGGGGTSTNTFTGVGDPGLTRAQAINTTFTTPPQILRTTGYSSPGDYGGALYKKIDALPADPLNVGTFTTLDGAHYQMVPNGADVYVNAFGAQSRATNDLSHDNWQAFEDCKYWILSQQDAASLQAANMRIAPGCYYLSKAHSMEGGQYSVLGTAGNTMIRVPWNQDGIQLQHSFGAYQTIGHEGGPINAGFPVAKGLEVYWPGDTKVYVCTTAGSVTNTAPTGTGTGITAPGGTAVFSYVRELTWSEKRGQNAGNLVQDLTIWSLWDQNDVTQRDDDVTVPGGGFHSGIVMKNRATISRVFAAQFPGHGICVAADGDPEVRAGGNANQWRIDKVQAYWNGHDGIHIGYSDANAGVGIDIDVASNWRWGVNDASFFGNRWLSLQSANDGRKFIGAKHPGMCVHNGYWWLARVPALGADLTEPDYTHEPGTDPISWIRWSGDGQAFPGDDTPIWSPSIAFSPCGPYSSNNIQCVSQWYGTYVESGANPPQFAIQNTVFGGIGTGSSPHGEQVYQSKWSRSLVVSTYYSGADGGQPYEVAFGPDAVDAGSQNQANTNIFSINGGGNNVSLCGVQTTSPPSITGSIADVVANSAAFHGQIGVGDGSGNNVFSNVLFVTSTEAGTVQAGQTISGAGIPAGTIIGGPTGFWPNSFQIVTADGSKIGNAGDSTVPGITNEAMTAQFVLPVLTVTACPTDAISLGANLSGGGITGAVSIAKQLDPTTLANVSFTGGVGKYALSSPGRTIASTTFQVSGNGTKNTDFALTSIDDRGTHVWGWTGRDSKRKFGRVNPVHSAFFASEIALGEGGSGMDNQTVRILRGTNGAPDNGGDYAHGEWRYNNNPTVGTYPMYQYVAAGSGIAGAPCWKPHGTVYS